MAAAKNEERMSLTVSELHDLFEAWSAKKKVEEQETKESVQEDPAVIAWLEERVPIQLFRDGKDYRDDVFVAVGSTRMQIRRGETVMVPRKIAMVLEESNRQTNHAADRQKSLSDSLLGIL